MTPNEELLAVTPALEPCPFCGGRADTYAHDLEYTWSVRCCGCSAAMNYVGLSKAEAITAWNTRHRTRHEDALKEALREVRPQLEGYRSDLFERGHEDDAAHIADLLTRIDSLLADREQG